MHAPARSFASFRRRSRRTPTPGPRFPDGARTRLVPILEMSSTGRHMSTGSPKRIDGNVKALCLALALVVAASCDGCTTAATASAFATGSTPPDTSEPARIAIHGMDDSIVGYLVLGRSTPAEAARLLSAHGGLGPRRDNDVTFQVGSATLRPRLLYTPPGTMHQLYFENDTLVLVVDGMPHGVPGTRVEFMKSYPTAKETRRASGWYELQTPLDACVWLIAVFTETADRLDSVGYATACSPR